MLCAYPSPSSRARRLFSWRSLSCAGAHARVGLCSVQVWAPGSAPWDAPADCAFSPSCPEPQPSRCFGHCTPSASLIFYFALKGKSTNPVLGRAGGCSVVSRAHSFPPKQKCLHAVVAGLLPHGAPGWLSRLSMQLLFWLRVMESSPE